MLRRMGVLASGFFFERKTMVNAIELLRNVAGLMFWAFIDLALGTCWVAIIIGLGIALVNGARHDD